VIAVIAILLVLLIPGFFFFNILQKRKKMSDILSDIAFNKNGNIKKSKNLQYPKLNFNIEGMVVNYQPFMASNNIPAHTKIECLFNFLCPMNLIVFKKSLLNSISYPFEGDKVITDNFNFNENFIIKSNNQNLSREFLSIDIQKNLLELKRDKPVLKIENNKFSLDIENVFFDKRSNINLIDITAFMIQRIKSLSPQKEK